MTRRPRSEARTSPAACSTNHARAVRGTDESGTSLAPRTKAAALVGSLLGLAAGCRPSTDQVATSAPSSAQAAPGSASASAPGRSAPSAARPASSPGATSEAGPPSGRREKKPPLEVTSASGPIASAPVGSAAWKGGPVLEKPVDIATGAYVALGSVGAVVRRKDDEMLLVRLGDRVTTLSDDGKLYSRTRTVLIDRGAASMAYWVSEGKLRRRLIDQEGKTGSIETVADDAEDGFVPHGVRNEEGSSTAQDVVAYVGHKRSRDGERQARVWVEGKGTSALSVEGTGAASTWVVSRGPGRFTIVWSDARAALTPIHAAPLELDGAGEVRLSPDTTLWMGSPSETLASVVGLRVDDTIVAMTALPRDGLDFGLATLPVSFGAAPLDSAVWRLYPNGLDPAPVIPARLCGQPLVALARPVERPIDSPRAVVLATVEASGQVTERVEVARASRIDHLTVWVSPHGDGWLGWVGDGRTKLRRVRCGK